MNYKFKKIIENIPGAEGPAVDSAGRIFMVAPKLGQVIQVEKGSHREVLNTRGMPAGLQIDSMDNIWIADMRRGILCYDKLPNLLYPLVSHYEGEPIRGCNDLALTPQGCLYFTAPGGSSEKNPVGEVFWRDTNGKVERFDQGLAFPNGIAVSPDLTFLVFAETFGRRLWRWYLDKRGKPVQKELFAVLPGNTSLGGDGMDFDAEGYLLATNYGESEIDVYTPKGELNERIALPFKNPSNIDALYEKNGWVITEHQSNALWHFKFKRSGLKQPAAYAV